MKSISILIVSIITTVIGGPISNKLSIDTIREIKDTYPDGTYNYAFETENKLYAEEQGFIKNPDEERNGFQVMQGQYQYESPDGQVLKLLYVADENGFQPQAEYLPTPPPIPPLIKKALKFLESLGVSKSSKQ